MSWTLFAQICILLVLTAVLAMGFTARADKPGPAGPTGPPGPPCQGLCCQPFTTPGDLR